MGLGALVGPSQVGGRIVEMAGKGRHHPLWTMTGALVMLSLGLALLSFGLGSIAVALIVYGAGNGVFSIAKGTLPLVLLGPHRYAPLVGKLARPSLVAQALAPSLGAYVLERWGVSATYSLLLAMALISVILGGGLWLARSRMT